MFFFFYAYEIKNGLQITLRNILIDYFAPTIIHKISETNSSFLVTVHYGKSLVSVFQELFANINKIFILTQKLGTRLSFREI